jgi:hypothetical protein
MGGAVSGLPHPKDPGTVTAALFVGAKTERHERLPTDSIIQFTL